MLQRNVSLLHDEKQTEPYLLQWTVDKLLITVIQKNDWLRMRASVSVFETVPYIHAATVTEGIQSEIAAWTFYGRIQLRSCRHHTLLQHQRWPMAREEYGAWYLEYLGMIWSLVV